MHTLDSTDHVVLPTRRCRGPGRFLDVFRAVRYQGVTSISRNCQPLSEDGGAMRQDSRETRLEP